MAKYYTDPSNPGSFSSIANLSRASGMSIKDARNFLLSQDSYTLHKLPRKRFPRNSYYVDNIDELWQCDLCDLKRLTPHNDGYRYLLINLDVFSKFAFVVPLKTKTNAEVIEGFKKIFSSGRKCYNLQSDRGREFLGAAAQNFLKKEGVNYYPTRNPDTKAACVERFIRTLRDRLARYLTHANTFRYIDVIQDIVKAYNNSWHSTIKMKPSEVNEKNVLAVWERVYRPQPRSKKPKLKVGMKVRITREKHIFEKASATNFTQEIFTIKKVVRRPIPVYELVDEKGEELEGLFYEHELQQVTVDDEKTYQIDKILQHRKRRGIPEVLVSWVGYDSSFNRWVPQKDIVDI